MIKKINIPIEDKVFSETDILQFAKKLYERYKKDRGNRRLSLELKILDGSGYELKNSDPTELAQVLQSKKVYAINFDYYFFDKGSNVSLRLNEIRKWDNYIYIQATNNTWLSSVESAMSETLRDVKPQTNFIIKNKKILFHVSCFYIGFFVLQLLNLTLGNVIKPIENPPGWIRAFGTFIDKYKTPFWVIVTYGNGCYWTMLIYQQLDKIWPPIEFDFGPEYMKKSKIRRKTIWTLLTVLIIPLLFQFVFWKH